MAANSRSSSKAQSKGAKKPAPKKKAASNTAKKTAKPIPKKVSKPVAHTTTQKAPQKTLPTEKKEAEARLDFDRKIDQLAKKSSSSSQSGSKTVLKTFIGILIIIAAAAVVYLFYPKAKSAVIKDEAVNKPVPPTEEIKLPEPAKEPVKPEPKKEAAKPKPVDENIYVVKYKDQLTEISKKQYGSFIEWKRIYEANKDKIKNPNLIFPGQELVIPKIQK
jgi:nucleoid-associated protein YgaU